MQIMTWLGAYLGVGVVVWGAAMAVVRPWHWRWAVLNSLPIILLTWPLLSVLGAAIVATDVDERLRD